MKYSYEAMNQSGQGVKGTVEAESQEDALSKIRNLGYFPLRIRSSKEAGEAFEASLSETVQSARSLLRRKEILLWGVLAVMIIGLAMATVIPLVYWWNHDSLTEMQVLKHNIEYMLGGMFLMGFGFFYHKWASQ